MKESVIQKKIMDYIRKVEPNVYLRKICGGPMFQTRGIPDLIGSWRGRFIGIEIKIESGKITELQRHEALQIIKSGGLYMCVYGYDHFLKLWGELVEKVGRDDR